MKAISLSLFLGLLISLLSATINFIDDPIPAPGTSYRGLPLPWLKTRPMLAPVRQWNLKTLQANSRISLGSFFFDSLFGVAYRIALSSYPCEIEQHASKITAAVAVSASNAATIWRRIRAAFVRNAKD